MRKDNVLFIISNDITDEVILGILAAMQAYVSNAYTKIRSWNAIHRQNEELDLAVYIVCDEYYHYLFQQCMPNLAQLYVSKAALSHKIAFTYFTYIVELSYDRIKRMCSTSNKPFAVCAGIILGSESSTLPDVSNLLPSFIEDIDLLCSPALVDLNELHYIANRQVYENGYSLYRRIELVYRSKVVFGESSFETYLAAALHKPVIEIQPNQFLYKWSSKKYVVLSEFDKRAFAEAVHYVSRISPCEC
jgi:hypothetical protein